MNNTASWYLGLELGSQGLAAALWQWGTVHPHRFRWHQDGGELESSGGDGNAIRDRIPMVIQFTGHSDQRGNSRQPTHRLQITVGDAARQDTPSPNCLRVEQFHTYLHRAIPCYSRQQKQWLPQISGPGGKPIPLHWFQRGLQLLLGQLLRQPGPMVVGDLTPQTLATALQNLAGVILPHPTPWEEAYRFNLREAVLGAKLVANPEQIFLIPNPTALALAHPPTQPTLYLVSNEASTDLAIALPDGQIFHQSHPYGRAAFHADIFYQLLYPQWLPEQDFLNAIAWDFPWPGNPDRRRREAAAVALTRHPMGEMVLTIAARVAQILHHQPTFTTQLGAQTWGISREGIQEKILRAWFESFNSVLNDLLSVAGVTTTDIETIYWQGDFLHSALTELTQQLSWKLPHAQFQGVDTPLAMGAAQLPQRPNWGERAEHQYSDFFLVAELLRIAPSGDVTLDSLCGALQRRGVNAKVCRDPQRAYGLTTMLQGQLPPGLIPDREDPWILPQGAAAYRALTATPLFTPNDNGTAYRFNHRQAQRLEQYLNLCLATTHQTLQEPLSFNLCPQVLNWGEFLTD
ncbi:hypothetical protein VB712_12620 [Spirulina sp. CCNP1310]|uniref:hypothetical protein n=1 Tax=Spirulina sp. CCNP1310 TaxID=3110249 RepID=UPI002B1ECC65|nr:hypothetical protein [Spirulina sp. CCNP1310]MEA5420066.1 hypothetical protein [Spirulina sp. CCNP1310]